MTFSNWRMHDALLADKEKHRTKSTYLSSYSINTGLYDLHRSDCHRGFTFTAITIFSLTKISKVPSGGQQIMTHLVTNDGVDPISACIADPVLCGLRVTVVFFGFKDLP